MQLFVNGIIPITICFGNGFFLMYNAATKAYNLEAAA